MVQCRLQEYFINVLFWFHHRGKQATRKTSRENELQEKLDQAVQYLEQINKEYETERERHLETLKEKEELESANVKYEEAFKELETAENFLREEREKNENCRQNYRMRAREEAIAKMKALMTSCQTANKKYEKAIKEQEKAETLLTEERNKNEKLMTEMQNEEKLKCFEEQALSKVKRLMDISKTANKKYKVAVREQEIAGKLLKEEKLKNESLLAKLEDERASSKLMKSTTRPEEKDDSAALKRLNQSLIEEKRLHSETKRINKELQSKLTTLEMSRGPSSQGSISCSETMEGSTSIDTVTDLPDPKTLTKEDLVTLVDELGAERKSHKRQLQQYNEMMNDMSGPSVNSCGSGVIASVAVLHLKSHNYHLEKENIVVEKKLKKVSELYKTERSKYEEMKEKKEYWKGEYSKFIHGKRKLDAPTTSKPLKDNNSPAVHQSPAKRVRNANVSEKPVRKDQPSLESAAWLDAEIENLQDQENCTTTI
ncbi:hypothetical protein BSL78_12662, partial [Apostichopus japonicus]